MRTYIHLPQKQTSLTFLVEKILCFANSDHGRVGFRPIILSEFLIYYDIYRKSLTCYIQAYPVKIKSFSCYTNFLNHHTHTV